MSSLATAEPELVVEDREAGIEHEAETGFIGTSPAARNLRALVKKIAPSSASVLLVGESGSGKELVARMVHAHSRRSRGPFVPVHCGAIPESLTESELFGHEKGAFTGACSRRAGCFELSNRGTLFLDELGAMPLSGQVKLLRVLEERSFRRLRGSEEIRVNVRIVAALNEDPARAVADGKLRDDLYYRLNVFQIHLPPLRDRVEDIPLIAERFVRQFASANGKRVSGLSPEASRCLARYRWPGNVRELRNVMENAVIVSKGWLIQPDDLPRSVLAPAAHSVANEVSAKTEAESVGRPAVGMSLEETTRWLILQTLQATDYNKTRTAKLLGVSPKTVYNKLREWSEQGDAQATRAEASCQERRFRDRGRRPLAPSESQPASTGRRLSNLSA